MKLDMIPSYNQGSIEINNHHYMSHNGQHFSNNSYMTTTSGPSLDYSSSFGGNQHGGENGAGLLNGDAKRLKAFNNYEPHQMVNNSVNEATSHFGNQEVRSFFFSIIWNNWIMCETFYN